MRIVCPACETGYQIADGTLGVTGRKVRCARCGTVWHATPNDYPDAPIDTVPTPRPANDGPEPSEDEWRDAIAGTGPDSAFDAETQPEAASEDNDQSAIDDLFASGPESDDVSEETPPEEETGGNDQSAVDDLFSSGGEEPETPDSEEPPSEVAEASPTIEAPPAGFEEPRRKPRGKAKRRGASTMVMLDRHLSTPVASVLLIGFLVMFCVVGVLGRQRIVATLPDLAGIYELLGLKVNLRGLDFQNVTARQEMDGSTPVLLVEGDIINLDSESKGLPAVRVTLKSSTGRDVYAWNYALPQLSIDQMGKVHFKTRLLAPPEASVTVEVRFTDQRQP
ncbi:MJ0042-type zinc finger domain-containing protein [Pleomorphomonas sp. JP5]|uniref:MJ0042-type zinc finger domain-containing protein n=1 Tax=Pleomorphomonas sp. JP5 TaxID=2942998 RepID=UPI0020440578|nr:zinc-ribbon domain-containing protein [Pleomorphomonas sp. JP5]MCM5556625.1 zinc-ribbon domain-containing protein [Pleomorphomonas sp. JP5]